MLFGEVIGQMSLDISQLQLSTLVSKIFFKEHLWRESIQKLKNSNILWEILYQEVNFIFKGTAGAIGLSIVYPLDFARTRLGTDLGNDPAKR